MIDVNHVNTIYALTGIVILLVAGFDLMIGWFLLRQSRDIAALRRDANQYMQVDLQIKRNKLQQTAKMPADPLLWFNTLVARVTESDSRVTLFPLNFVDCEPSFLQGEDGDGRAYVLAPYSREALKRLPASIRLYAQSLKHPLTSLPRGTQVYECSVLSTDNLLFDAEAAFVWNHFTKQYLKSNKLWLYVLPKRK